MEKVNHPRALRRLKQEIALLRWTVGLGYTVDANTARRPADRYRGGVDLGADRGPGWAARKP
ncbi:MAG: hypothetical protein ACE5OS_14090 [Anaerolineae bacterium]